MTPLFRSPAGGNRIFRGNWADSRTHPDRFGVSAFFGTHNFRRISQQEAGTTINGNGLTAIRANLPPVGFNGARIGIMIEGVRTALTVLDLEVPAIVVVDPGHGGTTEFPDSSSNNATSPSGAREKNMTLDYGLALRNAIISYAEENKVQMRVRMTREDDRNIPGRQRAAVASNLGADVFLSLHFNASNGVSRGSESLIRGVANVNEAEDQALGRRVLNGVLAGIRNFDAGGATDRGVKNFAWSRAQQRNVPSVWATLSDEAYANVETYRPIRGAISEVEFIDVPSVDILLNTGPEAAGVRDAIVNGLRQAIFEDINHQP